MHFPQPFTHSDTWLIAFGRTKTVRIHSTTFLKLNVPGRRGDGRVAKRELELFNYLSSGNSNKILPDYYKMASGGDQKNSFVSTKIKVSR